MLKKVAAMIGILILLKGTGMALSSAQQATFTVAVASVFNLSIDQGVVDFGRMKPGEVKWNIPPAGILVNAKTNNGKPWFLKISNDSPFTYGSYIIPNSNLVWNGWTDGSGLWYGNGKNAMTTTPTLVYASAVGEENNLPNGTDNHMKFKLSVPGNQNPGSYMTTVTFTMTE